MNPKVELFLTRSAQEIRDERPGTWDDDDLLDVVHSFQDKKDDERANATLELMLHSPEISEMLDYGEIYFMLYENLRWHNDYAASLRWLHAAIAYAEQNEEEPERANLLRDLAETYLRAGDFNTGVAIMTRALRCDPHDVWTHNVLGLTLPDQGLAALSTEVLTRGLELIDADDEEGLHAQFTDLAAETNEQAAQETSRLDEIDPELLQAFRTALQSDEGAPAGYATYLPPLDQLISVDEEQLPTLNEIILAQGKVLAPELIRMASDQSLADSPALDRSLHLLRQLQETQAVALDELANWLEQADANWMRTLHSAKIGKIGGFTIEGLENIAADTSYNPDLRTNAITALLDRMQHDHSLSDRLLPFLRALLAKPEGTESATEERFVTFLISEIVDAKLTELYPEIEAAFDEDRVDPQFITLNQVQEDLELPVTEPDPMPRSDGLYLLLKCRECARERHHFVQHVTVDQGTLKQEQDGDRGPYDAHVMDHEIVCPKCGARDRYTLSPLSALQLLMPEEREDLFANLFSSEAGTKPRPKRKPNPRVHRFTSMIMGRQMHPLEGIDRYQARIAKEPLNADNYVRMGNIYHMIHRYPEALAAFKQAYTLAPTDFDAILTYAMADHDFGDRKYAKTLYEEAVTLAAKTIPPTPESIELMVTANDGLRALARNQPSPRLVDPVTATQAPPPAPRTKAAKRPKRQKNKPTKKVKKKRKRGK